MARARTVGLSLWCILTGASLFSTPAAGAAPDKRSQSERVLIERLKAGVKYMLDGYHDKAIDLFSQVEREYPESPAGPLRRAEAQWWKIFKTEGLFEKLHEMSVLKSKNPPYEKEFHAAVDQGLGRAEVLVKQSKTSAQAYFYLATAYGLKSQMEGGKDNMIASARSAKKMKQYLEKCLSLDPHFYDAYLGIGLYNYYIGSLPAVLKTLKFTLGLPGGDRLKGMEWLRLAKDRGGFLGAEAKFYLAGIYLSPDHKNYGDAAGLVVALHKEYPNNPTYHLLLGYIYEKMGKREQARLVYDDILQKAQRKSDNYDEGVARQASAP